MLILKYWKQSFWEYDRDVSQWKRLTMTAMVKSSAQIEPFRVSKGDEICLFYSFVIVLKISRFFFILLLQKLEIWRTGYVYTDL